MTRTEQIMALVAELHGQTTEDLEVELGLDANTLQALVQYVLQSHNSLLAFCSKQE